MCIRDSPKPSLLRYRSPTSIFPRARGGASRMSACNKQHGASAQDSRTCTRKASRITRPTLSASMRRSRTPCVTSMSLRSPPPRRRPDNSTASAPSHGRLAANQAHLAAGRPDLGPRAVPGARGACSISLRGARACSRLLPRRQQTERRDTSARKADAAQQGLETNIASEGIQRRLDPDLRHGQLTLGECAFQ